MWTPDKHTVLEAETLARYLGSPERTVRVRGFELAIDRLAIEGRRATAQCSIVAPRPEAGGRLQVPAAAAVGLVTSAASAHAWYLNECEDQQGEGYLEDINLNACAVVDPDEMELRLELIARAAVPASGQRQSARTRYKWRVDLGNGNWFGTIALGFPFLG